MQTQHLSRAEYYNSRNINIPRCPNRILPQPSPQTHFNSPLPNFSIQVQQYNATRLMKEQHESELRSFEPQSHHKGVEIQDLRRQLANRMDQITSLKSQSLKDQKRIEMYERQVFDLKGQLQKMQHEFENKIQFILEEEKNQRQIQNEKIAFLQKSIQNNKSFYSLQLKATMQKYETQIKSYTQARATINSAQDQIISRLNKQIQRYTFQNQSLKAQMILLERQIDSKAHELEKQNFQLKNQLDSTEAKYQMTIKMTQNDIEQKNIEIKYLNEQINQLKESFDTERKRIIDEKDYIEKLHSESQRHLQQNLNTMRQEKQKAQQQIFQFEIQIKEQKEKVFHSQRRCTELSSKMLAVEAEKHQLQLKSQQTIDVMTSSARFRMEEDMEILKMDYEKRITDLNKDLDKKTKEIEQVEKKYKKSEGEKVEKTYQMRQIELKEISYKKDVRDLKEQNQKFQRQINDLRFELKKTKEQAEKHEKELSSKNQQARIKGLEEDLEESKQKIQKLSKRIKQLEERRSRKEGQLMDREFQLTTLKNETKAKEQLYSKNLAIYKLNANGFKSNIQILTEKIEKQNKQIDWLQAQNQKFHKLQERKIAQAYEMEENYERAIKQKNTLHEKFSKIQKESDKKHSEEIKKHQNTIEKLRKQDQIKQQTLNSMTVQQRDLIQKAINLSNKYNDIQKKLAQTQQQLRRERTKTERAQTDLIQQKNNKIIEEFQQKITQLHQKIQQNDKVLKDSHNENIKISSTNKILQAELKKITIHLREKEVETTILQDRIKLIKTQQENIEKQNSDMNSKLFTSENEKRKLSLAYETFAKKVNEWLKRIPDLETTSQQDIESGQIIQKKLKNVVIKIEKLNSENRSEKVQRQSISRSYQQFKQQAQEEANRLRITIQQHEETIKQLEMALNVHVKETKAIQQKQQILIKDLEKAKHKLQAKIQEADSERKKAQDKERQIKLCQRDLEDQKRRYNRFEQQKTLQLKQRDCRLQNLQKRFIDAQQQLGQSQYVISSLEQNQINLTIQINQSKSSFIKFKSQKEQELQNLQRDYNYLKKKYEQQIKKQKQISQAYLSQIQSIQTMIEHQKSSYARLNRTIDQLKQDNQKALKEKEINCNHIISSLRAQYEKNISSLHQQIKIHKEEVEKLRKKNDSEIRRLTLTLQKSRKQAQADLLKIHLQLNEKTKKINSLNTTNQTLMKISKYLLKYKARWDKFFGDFRTEQFKELKIQGDNLLIETVNASKSMTEQQFDFSYFLSSNQIESNEMRLNENILDSMNETFENTEKKEGMHPAETEYTAKVIKLTKGQNEVLETQAMKIEYVEQYQVVETTEFFPNQTDKKEEDPREQN